MSDLIIVRAALNNPASDKSCSLVHLVADRATLAKRRWRGVAEDGKEFGFDLSEPFTHGVAFHLDGQKIYVTAQTPEEVLEIPIATPVQAARIAWNLGNLHFGVQVTSDSIRVQVDPAVMQLLAREGVAFKKAACVFLPQSAGSHHHGHGHHHG